MRNLLFNKIKKIVKNKKSARKKAKNVLNPQVLNPGYVYYKGMVFYNWFFKDDTTHYTLIMYNKVYNAHIYDIL